MDKIKLYLNYLTYIVSLLIPKKKNRWVFGAWFGNRISDNSYALYRYVAENHPQIEAVWICNDVGKAREAGVEARRRNSLSAIWKCLTARVSVMNQGYLDLGNYNWIHNSYRVQLWHGVPWKKIGEDTGDEKTGLLHRLSHSTFLFANRCDLYIAPSDETRRVLVTAFLTDDGHILSAGQPRNEALMDEEFCRSARRKLADRIGGYQKYILYMPTFRDKASKPFSFAEIYDEIADMLAGHDAVILEKQHYVQLQRGKDGESAFSRIVDVADFETQELLAAADVLVTDYSSCFFDFLLRDRPIIHYIYDYENYKNDDRGLYYDADYVTAGPNAFTKDELVSAMKLVLDGVDAYADRRETVRKRFDTYESRDNSRMIFDRIIRDIG